MDSTLGEFGRFAFDKSYTEHKLLRLMEADGREEIEGMLASADADDFYTAGDELSAETTPSSHRYDGAPTNIVVSDVARESQLWSATVDVGSGCALLCSAAVPTTAWPGQPVRLWSEVTTANCTGVPSSSWAAGDGSTRSATLWQHLYGGVGEYAWSFQADLGDASCPRSGSVLVCEDERCWQWRERAPMASSRWAFDAVVLDDGRVLVAGSGGPAELYDPASDSWKASGSAHGVVDGAT